MPNNISKIRSNNNYVLQDSRNNALLTLNHPFGFENFSSCFLYREAVTPRFCLVFAVKQAHLIKSLPSFTILVIFSHDMVNFITY